MRMPVTLNVKQAILGSFFLAVGITVYVQDRYPIYDFLSSLRIVLDSNFMQERPLFGLWSDFAPSFCHAAALCLITGALVHQSKSRFAIVCLSWITIDVFFELMQAMPLNQNALPAAGLAASPFFSNVMYFFSHGTFDPLDLAAVLFGGTTAYLIMIGTCNKTKETY
jgi:hypothetical protein